MSFLTQVFSSSYTPWGISFLKHCLLCVLTTSDSSFSTLGTPTSNLHIPFEGPGFVHAVPGRRAQHRAAAVQEGLHHLPVWLLLSHRNSSFSRLGVPGPRSLLASLCSFRPFGFEEQLFFFPKNLQKAGGGGGGEADIQV